jgi:hypothetical protein
MAFNASAVRISFAMSMVRDTTDTAYQGNNGT